MPRAKKAAPAPAPAPKPLADSKIAFSYAKFPASGVDGKSLADYETEIDNRGGSIVTKIDECTHLVATQAHYDKKVARVKQAISNDNINIVSFEWLEDCLKATSKVDETQYLLHVRSSSTTSPAGKKRARSAADDADSDADQSKSKKKTKSDDGKKTTDSSQRAKSSSLNIPLDEELPSKHLYKVYIDGDDIIHDVTLNQTNAGDNANKFYRIQLLVDQGGKHWCWTRWGRVGERGQSKMVGNGDLDLALKEFEKKFKDKNGNTWAKRLEDIKPGKYSYIERSYEDSDDEDNEETTSAEKSRTSKKAGGVKDEEEEESKPVESKLSDPVQRLIKLIFNQEHFNNTLASLDYDANKMPLGKLSKNTLLRGYAVLKDLASMVGSGTGGSISEKSNQYFSLIPHAFGRNRPPVLNDMNLIKKEIELLESLTDMQLANDIMKDAKGKKGAKEKVNLLDRQYEGLGMQEMTPLDQNSSEFLQLQDYLVKSGGHTHNLKYKVQDIFRIERQGEFDRFDKSEFAKMQNSDRRLLWHGSRCTNFGGILSQGLRIAPPEAPVSGYMFGKGVYLADMSSKSANYCASYVSGGIGLLLLCEAELGRPPLKLQHANYHAGEDAKKQGSVSTWGVGRTAPQGWKDAGCIHKNLKGVSMPDVVTKPPGPSNEAAVGLMYNEYIVYDVSQIKLRYLLRCEIK